MIEPTWIQKQIILPAPTGLAVWIGRYETGEIADKAEHYQLAEGQRLRVGEFIVTGKKRAGGGFEIPAWEKITVGSIKRADDPA